MSSPLNIHNPANPIHKSLFPDSAKKDMDSNIEENASEEGFDKKTYLKVGFTGLASLTFFSIFAGLIYHDRKEHHHPLRIPNHHPLTLLLFPGL